MLSLAVFSGSKTREGSEFSAQAAGLGKEFACRNLRLICGGGGEGLMEIIADSALAQQGRVTAIIPRELQGREKLNCKVSEILEVGSIDERKIAMQKIADGFVLFPGGLGSLDEFFYVYSQWKLGLHLKPIGILNIENFYSPLLLLLKNMRTESFIKDKHMQHIIVSDNYVDLLNKMGFEAAR